jgi:hypothetical protein
MNSKQKIDMLREAMRDGNWERDSDRQHLRPARSRPRHHPKAHDAMLYPDFYRQMGRDLEELFQQGCMALLAKYVWVGAGLVERPDSIDNLVAIRRTERHAGHAVPPRHG